MDKLLISFFILFYSYEYAAQYFLKNTKTSKASDKNASKRGLCRTV